MKTYRVHHREPVHRKARLTLWSGALFLICLGAVVVFASTAGAPDRNSSLDTKQNPPTKATVTSQAAFFGNAFWGRMFTKWSPASGLGYAYPFSRLAEFDWANYDATVAGLECPVVAGVHLTPAQQETNLVFNCEPEYLPEAKKWFTAFMLANNHTNNQGSDGFAETQQNLENAGIQYFGHYNVDKLDDICDIIAFPARMNSGGKEIKGQLPIALCGYHGVAKVPSAASLALMNQYRNHMPVIAMTHMGTEYRASADPIRTATYRAMIDNGADMVLGDHPHWIQNTEAYKGKLIAYSMGNFMFDQQADREVTRSAGFSVRFEVKNVSEATLKKWFEIGTHCGTYRDDCLARITQAKLAKLPFTYTIGVIGVDTSGRITHPASADLTASILERLDWNTTKAQLSTPYRAAN